MSYGLTVFLTWALYLSIAGGLFYWVWQTINKRGSSPTSPAQPTEPLRTIRAKSGLQSDILQEGTGPGAKNRDTLSVHFTAWLTTGEKVDSSYDRGRMLTFKLGTGAVIYGWDEALKGMKVGEKRKVTVPAELAYGKKGKDKVPPNSTVIFDVELMNLEEA